jgi:hypothetical protein
MTTRWTPPPEARGRGPWPSVLGRIGILLAFLVGGYFVIGGATHILFLPRLEIAGAALPDGPAAPGETVQAGVMVRNARWRAGAAYVVAVVNPERPDETEVEGPVIDVPARTTVPVMAPLALPPGRHVVSLVLFDAWRENVRVGMLPGNVVQVGRSDVRLVATDMPARVRRGETVACLVFGTNAGDLDEKVVPLAVLQREGRPEIERYGRSADLPAGAETLPIPFVFGTDDLEPGRYRAAVLFLAPAGDRLGPGVYGRPIEVR